MTHGKREVQIPAGHETLGATLAIPEEAKGVILFAHGSGSSRFSPRNQFVADVMGEARLGTLLLDLLAADEQAADGRTGRLRFDISLLAERLQAATTWLSSEVSTRALSFGYFGASTGAAAALLAAARLQDAVEAVVSRGGRPDLVPEALGYVRAPTLLIVGANDREVLAWNQEAYDRLTAVKHLEVVPGAGHLFEETGALDRVAHLAKRWFTEHLRGMAAEVV